ncbi:uncharacterized protein METZ01_LOCUS323752, partial [marine metagenome]
MKKWGDMYLVNYFLNCVTISLLFLLSCYPSSVTDNTDSIDFEVSEATIMELHNAMLENQVTSLYLVNSYLDRIDRYDRSGPALNSIIRLKPDAQQQAIALDKERVENGMRGPLH